MQDRRDSLPWGAVRLRRHAAHRHIEPPAIWPAAGTPGWWPVSNVAAQCAEQNQTLPELVTRRSGAEAGSTAIPHIGSVTSVLAVPVSTSGSTLAGWAAGKGAG